MFVKVEILFAAFHWAREASHVTAMKITLSTTTLIRGNSAAILKSIGDHWVDGNLIRQWHN
jgi:hypothetical protein